VSLKNPRYWTVAEVAKLLRLSRMTVYRMIASGEIDGIRPGKRAYRIPEQALRKFLPPSDEES